MVIVGIESSCDDTAVGIVKDGKVLSNVIFSQDHSSFGGVFPEYASREHLKKISTVYKQALKDAEISEDDIDIVASSYAPGLMGSLLIGYTFAKTLAFTLGKRYVPVHHIKGHIYAAMLENQVELPALALVASGGHTSLIEVDEDHNFNELSCTLDDAVGEAYDKVGRMIGLPFPAGKHIDNLSYKGEANIEMPYYKGEGFSFSGLKSFVYRYLEKNSPNIEDVASSFQLAVEKSIVPKVTDAFFKSNAKSFIFAGGVAANSGLRTKLREALGKIYVPSIKLCLDNGAMIAGAAYFMIKFGKTLDSVRVLPNLKLKDSETLC